MAYCEIVHQDCSFLIDTQADISLLKRCYIQSNTIINVSEKCTIKGITENTIKSLGTVKTLLHIQNFTTEHVFHVVADDFPIPSTGILGKDFIKRYNCIINYEEMYFSIKCHNRYFTVPLLQGPDQEHIIIPPRCEINRTFICQTKHDYSVIEPQEISKGVYVARSIISKENQTIRVLNTNNQPVKLSKNFSLNCTNLNEFDVYSYSTIKSNRDKNVLEKISKNVPDFASSQLLNLCENYTDIFALPEDKLSVNNFYEQKITLSDKNPVYIKNYRMPFTQKSEVKRQVTKMLDDGLIEPSKSNYNSPVILVPKKSTNGIKKWRMCIDFRALNKKIIPDKYPLPRIDDILDNLGRAKFFSVLDLFSGFHQVRLHEESRDVTSFNTEQGSFRFTVLPFGLNIAPNSFQRMMSIAFSGLNPFTCFLYLDDLIVLGISENHHLKNLKTVFETCRKFNLKLNADKCNFFRSEVTYLGHKCTDKGILPDDAKFEIIKNYPRPFDKDSTKRFIAFCNYYRRFIPLFAEIAYPLNKLTRKRYDFQWTDECENAYQKLKTALHSPPILQYPDFSKPFILTTDAAKYAVGAILSQNFEGHDLPIAYASRGFTKAELNKPTIEKELSGIHFAIKHFRPYIYGTKFIVKTDHKPLTYLFSMKDPSSKLTRMRLELSEYDFEIQYIKGKDNVGADALSRLDISHFKDLETKNQTILRMTTRAMARQKENLQNQELQSTSNEEPNNDVKVYEAINNFEIRNTPRLYFKIINQERNELKIKIQVSVHKNKPVNATILIANDLSSLGMILSRLNIEVGNVGIEKLKLSRNDEIFKLCTINEFKEAGNNILKNVNVIIEQSIQTITDFDEKLRILKEFHDDVINGGHVGQKRMYSKIRSKFFWKYMSKDIAQYVRNCHACKINKPTYKTREPLTRTLTPQKPFDIIIIDTIGPLQKSQYNNKYAVTIICDLSKYLVTVPIENKEAKTIAKAIFKNFILTYGNPKEIRTDMGTEYRNEILKELCSMLNISQKFTTPYRHESVGSIERNHRTLNEYLRSYITSDSDNWDEYLAYFTYCYNTTPSEIISNYSPFELVFNKQPYFNQNLTNKIDPIYNIENYAKEAKYRLQIAYKRTRDCLEKYKNRNKENYDTKQNPLKLNIGDKVLITNEARHKLDPLYQGPFIVKEVIEPNVTIINPKTLSELTIHKNRVRKYIQ